MEQSNSIEQALELAKQLKQKHKEEKLPEVHISLELLYPKDEWFAIVKERDKVSAESHVDPAQALTLAIHKHTTPLPKPTEPFSAPKEMITISIYQGKDDKLSPVTKELWLSALRSGVFQQGQVHLCSITPEKESKYCCMGVLCEVLKEPFGMVKKPIDNSNNCFIYEFLSGGSRAYMSFELVQFLGFANSQVDLIRMNDKEGKNFNEIADWIEKNL